MDDWARHRTADWSLFCYRLCVHCIYRLLVESWSMVRGVVAVGQESYLFSWCAGFFAARVSEASTAHFAPDGSTLECACSTGQQWKQRSLTEQDVSRHLMFVVFGVFFIFAWQIMASCSSSIPWLYHIESLRWELPYVQRLQFALGSVQEVLYLQCVLGGTS